MKTKMHLKIVLAAFVLLTVVNVVGKEHKRVEIRHESCGLQDLTDAQKKQIEAIDQNLDKAMIPLKAQMELKHAELNTLLVAEKPDKAAIDKKIEEIGAIRVQIQKKRIGGRLETRALLTAEQRTAFDKQTLGPRGGMMMDSEDGPCGGRMFMMRHEGPPPPGCMKDKEEIEIERNKE